MNAETADGLAETVLFAEATAGASEFAETAETYGFAETVGFAETADFAGLDQYTLMLRHFHLFSEEAIEMNLQLNLTK